MKEKENELASEDLLSTLPSGTIIDGKYEIIDIIGRGGMGTVYRAHHKFINKDVALKLLNKQLSNQQQVVLRFQREAIASARIEHRNVCQVTDSGKTADGQFYIVMELLNGIPLQKIIAKEAPFEISRIISIAKQICAGLEKAHEMKIIHRDLKPENIMILTGEDGKELVKIMDFGIAKVALDDIPATDLTTAGMVFGTPHYISPEQASGDPVDGRSDLYSLGCIIYEMATGKKPYESDTIGGLLRKHVTAEIPRIVESGKGNPPALEKLSELVAQLMAKSPDDRPSTARDVTYLLEKIEGKDFHWEDVSTASTLIIKSGEAGAKKQLVIIVEILKALLTFNLAKANRRARTLMEGIILPQLFQLVSVIKKYPVILVPWVMGLAGLSVVAVVLLIFFARIAFYGDDREKKDDFNTNFKIQKIENNKGVFLPENGKKDEIEEIIKKYYEYLNKGKEREALEFIEQFTSDLKVINRPSFLLNLAVARSKAGRHDIALDAIERCGQIEISCFSLPPMQEVMVKALQERSVSERASRYLAKYATKETIRIIEVLEREHPQKWLREVAFNILMDGGGINQLERWSKTTILFVNGKMNCKKKRELLSIIKKEGNPGALKGLNLFSSTSGCGFLGLSDCYRCFRKEWNKTVSALKSIENK